MSAQWPHAYADGKAPATKDPNAVTIDNAILFGFKVAIGMMLSFVPVGVVLSILIAAVSHVH